MKSKKKQGNPEIVVGDVAHKSDAPAEAAPAQPYLGGVQPGISKRKKVFVFVVLGILMLAAAGWLFTHRQKDEVAEPANVSYYVTDSIKVVRDLSGDEAYRPGVEIQLDKPEDLKNSLTIVAKLQLIGDLDNALRVLELTGDELKDKDNQQLYNYYYRYGVVANEAGDKDVSIKSFEKAIEYLKKTDEAKNGQQYIQAKLDSLNEAINSVKSGE